MSKKYKGVAEIELYNTKTKEVRKYEEHNMLTSLLDDVFSSNNLDGCIEYNTEIKNYLNKLVLFGSDFDNSSNCVGDNVNVIDTKIAESSNIKEYKNGLEFVFKFDEDEAIGAIECVSLAPSSYCEINKYEYDYDYNIRGTTEYMIGDNNFSNIVNIDVDNGFIYTLTHDNYDDYVIGNEFYVTLNKYRHNFNRIPIIKNEIFNYTLLESTNIEISDLFEGIDSNPFVSNPSISGLDIGTLSYSIDSNNKNLIITYLCIKNKEL